MKGILRVEYGSDTIYGGSVYFSFDHWFIRDSNGTIHGRGRPWMIVSLVAKTLGKKLRYSIFFFFFYKIIHKRGDKRNYLYSYVDIHENGLLRSGNELLNLTTKYASF